MALTGTGIAAIIAQLVFGSVIGALFIWLSVLVLKLRDKSFKTALKAAIVVTIVTFIAGYIPFAALWQVILIGLVLAAITMLVIQKVYSLQLKKAILTWALYQAFVLVLAAIVFVTIKLIT